MHHYLYNDKEDDTKFVLKQYFGFPFEGMHAKNYELRVILPEGS